MTTENNRVIAFVGLGHMGLPMATNLHKAGYTVRGVDISPEALAAAEKAGFTATTALSEAAEGADVLWTMLPRGDMVTATLNDAAKHLNDGALVIDSSTISVADARDIGKAANAAGLRFVDAPVSGGVIGAENGTLAFMVGGADEDVSDAEPLLQTLGRSVTHCGDTGAGQAVKICNNLILGIHQLAVCESMVLGERLGIDPKIFYEVVSQSTGASWVLNSNCPVPGVLDDAPSSNDYKPGYASGLMLKDLTLAAEALGDTRTTSRVGAPALKLFEQFCADGNAGKDFSAIYQLIASEK